MVVHGREIGFRLSVGATTELAELCPEKNFERLGELLDTESMTEQIDIVCKMIAVMSKWYEKERKWEDASYVPNPLTEEELMCLDTNQIMALEQAMFETFKADSTVTVETEDVKKK